MIPTYFAPTSIQQNSQFLRLCGAPHNRKIYLFAGSDAGAERAAILYSLLQTCALHGVEAFTYLKDVLGKPAAGWPTDHLDKLLPENWSPRPSVTKAQT